MTQKKWSEIPGRRKKMKGITFCEGGKRGLEYVYGHYRLLEASTVDGTTEVRERDIPTAPIYAKDLPPAERILLENAVAAARILEWRIWQTEEAEGD